jgi:hypothetical protein
MESRDRDKLEERLSAPTGPLIKVSQRLGAALRR